MRAYITGGTGFFGRRIVEAVKEAGHEAIAPRSTEADLMSLESLNNWFEKQKANGQPIEAVIHSAAYYGGLNITMSEPASIYFKNVRMINNLFEASAKAGVSKIVSVGSACSYPGDIAGDMEEKNFWSGALHDSVEAYGFTKKIQLVAQHAYNRQYGIGCNHLVITNLYGENDVFNEYRGHAIAVLIKRYVDAAIEGREAIVNWGDGSAVREFMHVADAAKVVADSLSWASDFEPVNVGTGIGTSIRELCELLTQFSGYAGKVEWDTTKPNGVLRKVLNIDKLKRLMPQYTPTPLADGLKKTVDWYRENKEEADKRA